MISPRLATVGLAFTCVLSWSCGGPTSGPPNQTPPTITAVAVASSGEPVLVGYGDSFYATVKGTGAYSTAVTWAVNGVAGGDAQNGTITNGAYSAPNVVPPINPITITATSVQDPTKSGNATASVFSVTIFPANPSLLYGQQQQFTAGVAGLDDPTIQWSAILGQISSAGLYSSPAQGFFPATDTVTATVLGTNGYVSTSVSLQTTPPKLDSIAPSAAIVGQTVTLNTENLVNANRVFFSLPNGNVIAADFTSDSTSQLTATVPVGVVSGPVYIEYIPPLGGKANTNSVNFTRLPNLHIRAQSKELSSGETTQFNWSFLGGSTTSPIEWSSDKGSISAGGLFRAPVVSAEQFATITGCISGSQACDSVMVRVLPFRIDPPVPVVTTGNTIQLDAVQGGSFLSPSWSLPAGAGLINSHGLFTASSSVSSTGGVPVRASSGGGTQNSAVAVAGGFPGIVNRVWDYLDFKDPGNLGMYTETVAVAGNVAYCLDLGAPYAHDLSYAAIDAYDISDPSHPVWLGATDAISNLPLYIFTYDHYLISVDSGFAIPVPSRIAIYDIQNQIPVLKSVTSIPDLALSTINDGVIYGFGDPAPMGSTTVPVYTFDVRSGSVVQNEYQLPPPIGSLGFPVTGFLSITGSGNMIYASQSHPDGTASGKAIDAFDISTSPPTLVTWIPTLDYGFELQAVGQVVFADNGVFDFSASPPTKVGEFPMLDVKGVDGNHVLALGEHFNYLVIDVSNHSSPIVLDDFADLGNENPFGSPNGTISGKNVFAADGLGGMAVYDISVPGGQSNEPPNPFYEEDASVFYQIFDQVISGSTLFAAGATDLNGDGGLVTFDTSGSQPVASGRLVYTNEVGYAVQVSGNAAYLGLNDKLKVVDVSNVSSPIEVGSLNLPVNALALSGNTLFVGTGDSRLMAFDVSNPTSPVQLGITTMAGPPTTMRVAGTLLYVADGEQGLLVFDISHANAPTFLSQLTLSAPVWDVAPSGTTALLAADSLGLVVADVSNPSNIKQLSQTTLSSFNPFPVNATASTTTFAISIATQNGLVYIGTATTDVDAADALVTYDISQPSDPRLVGFRRQTLDEITVVTPSGSDLFLADAALTTEVDNSLPRNVIELFEPPSAIAPTVYTPQNQRFKVYSHPKLTSGLRARPGPRTQRRVKKRGCIVASPCSSIEQSQN
jgi:hypothetical protein